MTKTEYSLLGELDCKCCQRSAHMLINGVCRDCSRVETDSGMTFQGKPIVWEAPYEPVRPMIDDSYKGFVACPRCRETVGDVIQGLHENASICYPCGESMRGYIWDRKPNRKDKPLRSLRVGVRL
jgi:hypothetical protein